MALLKHIDRLRLVDMMADPELYGGLADGLCELSVPQAIRFRRRYYPVPQTLEAFTKTICYGQRLFFTVAEENDFGIIIRVLDGYYYPLVTGKKWDADRALLFGKNVITCHAKVTYPAAMHFVRLIAEMAERERKLLHREPTKLELAAGIERLSVFAELAALDFLRDTMKVPVAEVLLTPYEEILVRFYHNKEVLAYQDRYMQLAEAAAKEQSKQSKTTAR